MSCCDVLGTQSLHHFLVFLCIQKDCFPALLNVGSGMWLGLANGMWTVIEVNCRLYRKKCIWSFMISFFLSLPLPNTHTHTPSHFINWLNVHYLVHSILRSPTGMAKPLNRRSLNPWGTAWGIAVQKKCSSRTSAFAWVTEILAQFFLSFFFFSLNSEH